jgi:hypothetical protein
VAANPIIPTHFPEGKQSKPTAALPHRPHRPGVPVPN